MKIKTLLFLLLTVSCLDSSFNKELDEWKSKRYNALYAEDGYLNLAGLFLLESGLIFICAAQPMLVVYRIYKMDPLMAYAWRR